MLMLTTNDTPELLARYRSVREKQRALHHDLLKNYLPKDAMVKSAKKLGIPFKQNALLFGSSEEMSILMDYCLYDYRDIPFKGKPQNAIEKRLDRDPPPPGSEELEILKASARARYTLILVESVNKGLGVNALDFFAQERFFLTDVGFGDSALPEMAMAARIVSPFGINMTTGAALPVDSSVARSISVALGPILKDKTIQELANLTPSEKSRTSATFIRMCLQSGTADCVRYQSCAE